MVAWIAVATGCHEGPGEVIRRLVDLPTDQGDGAARIERLTLDRLLVALSRLGERGPAT